MTMTISEMVDVVFDISGDSVPVNYPFELWRELVRLVPELEGESSVGVLPLRTTGSDCGMLLPKRAKLVVRLPRSIGGSQLKIGKAKLREIQPYSTIHAHLVVATDDEVAFVENVSARLADLGITASLICGRQNSLLDGDQCVQGFSLVIHDLKPEDSLRLQYNGLGSDRKFGCGIFVLYKAISDLN